MGDLAEGMDAGVGAAGALHLDGLATNACAIAHQGALHRESVFLLCQPTNGRTVILDVSL